MAKRTHTIFSRLLFYFILVMAIPLAIMIIAYFSYSDRHITKLIKVQTELAIENDAENISAIFDEYKHKAFSLASDAEIIEILKEDKLNADLSKSVYATIFSEMGSTSNAQAHIISSSGKIQLSTHIFPSEYDIRIYNNEWNSSNILSKAIVENQKETKSSAIISIQDHRTTESGKLIFATVLRRIQDAEGNIVGYAIIDIYEDALKGLIDTSSIFTEELLVDDSNYYAISLIHTNAHGSLDKMQKEDEDLIAVDISIPDTNFSLLVYADPTPYRTSVSSLMVMFLIALFIGTAFSILLSLIFSHSITKRFRMLADSMKTISEGNLSIELKNTGVEEFDQLISSFNKMANQLAELIELTREEEAKLAEAERKELESQLNPHFLFNTLNTIKALARLNGQDEIYTISIKLGKLLRSSLNKNQSECTIKESLELSEGYLTIQKIRFKDKINYEIDADESILEEMTPRLIIQPLVENAIIHGLEPMTEPGKVKISVKDREDEIDISIEDNGIGFDSSLLENDIENLAHSQHVGLYNVYRRLQLKYSKKLYFKIESAHNKGTKIQIKLPKGDK